MKETANERIGEWVNGAQSQNLKSTNLPITQTSIHPLPLQRSKSQGGFAYAVGQADVGAETAFELHAGFFGSTAAGDVLLVAAPGQALPGPFGESLGEDCAKHARPQTLVRGAGANPHTDLSGTVIQLALAQVKAGAAQQSLAVGGENP